MNTASKTIITKATAPTGAGTFSGIILYNPEAGDRDGERVDSWTNVPTTVALHYQHAKGDGPIGYITAELEPGGRLMQVRGQLDLSNPVARAVHERMTLRSDDPNCLSELSCGFSYLSSENTKDAGTGVTVIHNAELQEVSVVRAGAQATVVSNVKSASQEIAELNARLDALLPVRSVADLNRQLDAMAPPTRQPREDRLAQLAALNANQALLVRPAPQLDPRTMSEIVL
jgi:HK97 family phage prohead protease